MISSCSVIQDEAKIVESSKVCIEINSSSLETCKFKDAEQLI